MLCLKVLHDMFSQNTCDEGLKIETSQFGLKQIINEPTYLTSNSSLCIDSIFTSQPNLVRESDVHSSLHSNCHHQIAFAEINLKIYYEMTKLDIMKRRMLTLFVDQSINSLGISDLLT